MPGAIIRWMDLKELIDQRINAAMSDLEKAASDRDVGRAQGRLAAYRQMLNIPETLRMLTVEESKTQTGG